MMATQRDLISHPLCLRKPPPEIQVSENLGLMPVPRTVVYKLLGFTLAMVVVPIGSYFATVDLLFRGRARSVSAK
jgi:vacuolar ATPase assembly integral membrane protein VMA21